MTAAIVLSAPAAAAVTFALLFLGGALGVWCFALLLASHDPHDRKDP